MKLSLSWIFDHIDANWKDVEINELVDKFNKTTAEIEGLEKVSFHAEHFSLAEIKAIKGDMVTVFLPEWTQTVDLPAREDAVEGSYYMVKKEKEDVSWALLTDFNCYKDGFVPALDCEESLISGGWKKDFEAEDYILEVENKSVTHRPDMWGHRGFAREIAAIFNLPFKKIDEFITSLSVKDSGHEYKAKNKEEFSIKIEQSEIGKRFAGLVFPHVKNKPSSLWMAFRLMRVGSRPIDAIVDITNYVMLDTSQPMHAFDAAKLPDKKIVPRLGKDKEKLLLLDGDEVELNSSDYVISDGKKPIALAGIMGGKETGIGPETTAMFLESANFDADTIRKTSLQVKKRTEASARFEKTLDPNQNVTGILRLLKLFETENIDFTVADTIISLGKEAEAQDVLVTHAFIEKRLGVSLDSDFIVKTLDKIELKTDVLQKDGKIEYRVTVPTFRCTKDIGIEEDIVEEVGRFFGYENIPYELPKRAAEPYDLTPILRIRKIKRQLAFGLKMREMRNYPFYDETFLAKLGWEPKNYAEVKNPFSENWKKLATSLIPHLIKNIDQNVEKYHQLRFFEWARIWHNGEAIAESKSLAGIFFDAKKTIDFYDGKSWLSSLFDLLDIEVKWVKISEAEVKKINPWFFPYQSAQLICGDKLVGVAGKIDTSFISSLFEGDAFIFELDGNFLLDYRAPKKVFKPASKYPEVIRDVSMFIPLAVTVDDVTSVITSCDDRITQAYLVDSFQKDEWKDHKSLTFRFILRDYTKTLDKEEVDTVYNVVVEKLKIVGADIR